MPCILTVDNSRAIRSIVGQQVAALGFEVHGAEDGEHGLRCLVERRYDLVILDVTMPVLDGPGMLARMRERGDHTPVLMLTSESRSSVIAGCIKLGIVDYILKPFKPDELRAKLLKVVNAADGAPPTAVEHIARVTGGVAPVIDAAAGKQQVDLLIVDDMENVHRKLCSAIPAHYSTQTAVSAQAALASCRGHAFRVVLVDLDIPETNSTVLAQQMRTLQPSAVFVALALRHQKHGEDTAKKAGFDGVLFKPFDQAQVDHFVSQFFDRA